ncbi:DUF2510 domain-containing protein [Clavibacter michiganensis]|uniref:DUF2510 domain-containing protein n=1 Tax=Clavibacter michiganensis TaxID=28447 RepID=UPI00307A1B39
MTSTPSGWFPDQSDPDYEVFWDGSRWTGERRPLVERASPLVVDAPAGIADDAVEGSDEPTGDTSTSREPRSSSAGAGVLAFLRSVPGRWAAAALVVLLLLAVAVPAVVNGIQTQQREQALEREAEVQAARLAVEQRDDALVSRESTLEDARKFLQGDLSYASVALVTELRQAVEELEDVDLTDASGITSAVQLVKNAKTNVGVPKVPYTWSITCSDSSYNDYSYANFREVWGSSVALKSCETGSRSGDFYSDEQKAAVEAGAVSGLDKVGILENICAGLGFSTYGSMAGYSEGQAKELSGALMICPDHARAGEVRAKVDASLAEQAALANGTAFGAGVKRVGQDIQPGTYVTEGTLDGCYWERTDGAGEIIDNNFIGSALRAEVTIRAGDYSFSSNSCGTWKKQ